MRTLKKLKQFHATADVHGTDREVVFAEAAGDEPSMLAIKGLTVEDAIHILEHLSGGLLKGKDAEDEAPKPAPAAKQAKKQEAKAPPPDPKPAPAPEPVADVEDEAGDVDDLDDDLSDDGETSALDVAVMSKMTKLRELVLYMKSKGVSTPQRIVEESRRLKDQVPVLREAEARGQFDKRMERAALTILGEDAEAQVH